MKRACILLANGFEETEAVVVIDVLRRAEIHLDILGVEGKRCTGAHGIVIEADALLADTLLADRDKQTFDLVVLPGGMPGAATLRDHAGVQRLVRAQHEAGRFVSAICAAPIALARAGVLEGKNATCFPGFEDQLGGARFQVQPVVRDGNVITSRGVGTAMQFALALVEILVSPAASRDLASRMLVA